MKLLALVLLVTFAGCTIVGAPQDYPILPLPPETQFESIQGERVEGGVKFSNDEIRKLITMFVNLKSERDILRQTVEKYNLWVKEQAGR